MRHRWPGAGAILPGARGRPSVSGDDDRHPDAESQDPDTPRHALNNLLAALLAEAQVLSYDPALSAEHHDAVERIVQLTRRVIAAVRASEHDSSGASAPGDARAGGTG